MSRDRAPSARTTCSSCRERLSRGNRRGVASADAGVLEWSEAREKTDLLLKEMRGVRGKGAACLALLRQTVAAGSMHLEDAVVVRPAASLAAAAFGIRCASEVARIPLEDDKVDARAGAVYPKVNRQRND